MLRYLCLLMSFSSLELVYLHFRATEEKANFGPEDHVEEKGGRRAGPKKSFQWNEEIRSDMKKGPFDL